MKVITIDRFDRGMADDRLNGGTGEYAVAKHFDTLTNPRRLQPKRGMTSHTPGKDIGNLIVASDGLMYGSGVNQSNSAQGELFYLAGYGSGDNWAGLTTQANVAAGIEYDLLVDWPEAGNIRTIYFSAANALVATPKFADSGGGGTSSDTLTHSSIGQAFVHPKDKNLYFPYRTTTTPYIGLITNGGATPFVNKNYTAFQLPKQYRAYCLTNFGDYLAIPLTSVTADSGVNASLVALWNRDTSITTFNETIPWGAGALKVLNNVQGALVGISELSANTIGGNAQDYNSIQIKVYTGGAEPALVKEIKAIGLSGGTSTPSVSINTRVNFVYNGRLYFSANVNPNDGIQPSRIGMWSVGRNKTSGEWTVTLEHMATNTNTETSVLAAAMAGDYVEMVHSAAGTLTKSINGNPSSSTYAATSVFESTVNPQMEPLDRLRLKKLHAVTAHFQPLPASSTVTLKYRVDSNGKDSDWVTIGTASTTGQTSIECPKPSSGHFTDGRNYEFRLESTGGAVISAYAYKYDVNQTLL